MAWAQAMALHPSTAATGPIWVSNAIRHWRWSNASLSIVTSCLGCPSRLDEPAARMAMRISGIRSFQLSLWPMQVVMGLAGEWACCSIIQHSEDFGNDGDSDADGTAITKINADRTTEKANKAWWHLSKCTGFLDDLVFPL